MQLLAFGGPWNEQVVAVPDGEHRVLAPVPQRPARSLDELTSRALDWEHEQLLVEEGQFVEPVRTVTYQVRQVGFCHPSWDHTQPWLARCLVADGYPEHRITDRLTALANLTIGWLTELAALR